MSHQKIRITEIDLETRDAVTTEFSTWDEVIAYAKSKMAKKIEVKSEE